MCYQMCHQRQTAGANSMNLPLPTDRPLRRQVLECASLLAPFFELLVRLVRMGLRNPTRHSTGALSRNGGTAASKPTSKARAAMATALFACGAVSVMPSLAQPATANPETNAIRIVGIQGTVEVSQL